MYKVPPSLQPAVKSLFNEFKQNIETVLKNEVQLTLNDQCLEIRIHYTNRLNEAAIRGFVCSEFDMPFELIQSKTRKREVMAARMIYTYLCWKHLGFTFEAIGKTLGGRDHTTTIGHKKAVLNHIDTKDELVVPHLNAITDKINRINEHN